MMIDLGEDCIRSSRPAPLSWKVALPLITGLSMLSWGATGGVGLALWRLISF